MTLSFRGLIFLPLHLVTKLHKLYINCSYQQKQKSVRFCCETNVNNGNGEKSIKKRFDYAVNTKKAKYEKYENHESLE